MTSILRRLWLPGLVFVAFAIIQAYSGELVSREMMRGFTVVGGLVDYAIQIGLWLSGAFIAGRLINVLLWDRVVAPAIGKPVPRLLRDCVTVVVFLLALSGIVGIVFGQSVTGIWATSGVVGLVLGFALRTMILDIFTGIAIHLDQSIRIGDYVEINDRSMGEPPYGRVIDINWRTTRVRLDNNNVVVLPNGRLGTLAFTNYSMPDEVSRFELDVQLDHGVPTDRARRILLAGALAACGRNGVVEQPPPAVIIGSVGPLGVTYKVRYWQLVPALTPPLGRDQVLTSVLEHLRKAGITPAYPKQDLFYERMPQRHVEEGSLAQRQRFLKRVDILADALTEEERERLAEAMMLRSFEAGTTLIRQGEEGSSLFLLAEGLVEVWVAAEGGERRRVARLKPGKFFGEMSLLTGEPRSATITAATDLVAFEITKEAFAKLLESRPALAEAVSRLVAERRAGTAETLAAPTIAAAAASDGLANQLLSRMRRFFQGVFERGA